MELAQISNLIGEAGHGGLLAIIHAHLLHDGSMVALCHPVGRPVGVADLILLVGIHYQRRRNEIVVGSVE